MPAQNPAHDSPPLAPLKLRAVRSVFRLIGEVRERGSDPREWRPHMIRRLQRLLDAGVVMSSEIHFRNCPGEKGLRVTDIGWACDTDNCWQISSEREGEAPEAYWLLAGKPAATDNDAADCEQLVPVKPARQLYGGKCFLLSQVALPHLGAVDQLGLHRTSGVEPFTAAEHRLVRLFHVELARLWRRDALNKTRDASSDLPPRLTQTLQALLDGLSEKQIALRLDLSQHTVHNYVKALHQRFDVSSRGELLAKAGKIRATFLPQLSMQPPNESARP